MIVDRGDFLKEAHEVTRLDEDAVVSNPSEHDIQSTIYNILPTISFA